MSEDAQGVKGESEPTPEEWLALLHKSSDAFNDFREAHPQWAPLFPKNANLRRLRLSRVNLKSAYLLGAHLEDADLFEADLRGADMLEAHLDGANLVGADLEGASLWWAQASDADLFRAQLQKAQLLYANMRGAQLSEARLEGADLRSAQFQRANLLDAKLDRSSVSYVDFQNADLRGASFEYANIVGADFRGARVNRHSTVLARRRRARHYGDNPTADADALMQWAQLYKTHGAFELAGQCYHRARQHYRRERCVGLRRFSPHWLWAKAVSALETVFLDWSCSYGEKPGKVLLWAFAVIIASAFTYHLYLGNFMGASGRTMPDSVVTSIYFSTVTFTTLGLGDFHPIQAPYPDRGWWLPLFVSAEALTGALLMSLFLVTFARIMIRD